MYLWYLFVICMVGLFIYLMDKRSKSELNLEAVFGIMVGTGIAAFFMLFISSVCMNMFYVSEKCVYGERIKSLSLNSNFSIHGGGFFLGWSLDDDNEMAYYYYVETNNGLILKNTKASRTYLKETDDQPRLIIKYELWKNAYPNWTAFNLMQEENMRNSIYTLEIPKNTVKLKFDVDQSKVQ